MKLVVVADLTTADEAFVAATVVEGDDRGAARGDEAAGAVHADDGRVVVVVTRAEAVTTFETGIEPVQVKTGTGWNTGGGAARRGRSAASAEPAKAMPAMAVPARRKDFITLVSLTVPARP